MGEDSKLVINGCSPEKSADRDSKGVLATLLDIPTVQKISDVMKTTHDSSRQWSRLYSFTTDMVTDGLEKVSTRLLQVPEVKNAVLYLDEKGAAGVHKVQEYCPVVWEEPNNIYLETTSKLSRRFNHLKAYVASYIIAQKTLDATDHVLTMAEKSFRWIGEQKQQDADKSAIRKLWSSVYYTAVGPSKPLARHISSLRRNLRVMNRAGKQVRNMDSDYRTSLCRIGQRKKIKASPSKKSDLHHKSATSMVPQFLLDILGMTLRRPPSWEHKNIQVNTCSGDGGPLAASSSEGESEARKRSHSEMLDSSRTLLDQILDEMEDYDSELDSDYDPHGDSTDTDSMEYGTHSEHEHGDNDPVPEIPEHHEQNQDLKHPHHEHEHQEHHHEHQEHHHEQEHSHEHHG